MACNMLSYVEHYQPNFFLLENVAGFLEHSIKSSLSTSSGDEVHCTIKFGMVKFVTRALIALGSELFHIFTPRVSQFFHPFL
jgi:DNA (cytosine-5)-methyltransferase 1